MANKLFLCDCAFCLSLHENYFNEYDKDLSKTYCNVCNRFSNSQEFCSCNLVNKKLGCKPAIRNHVSRKKVNNNAREVALLAM